MRKIPTLLVILALVAMNFAAVGCVHASDMTSGDGIDVVAVLDIDAGDVPLQKSIQCDQCCCHAGFHLTLNKVISNNYDHPSVNYFISRYSAYLSTLNSPPFQPPKA